MKTTKFKLQAGMSLQTFNQTVKEVTSPLFIKAAELRTVCRRNHRIDVILKCPSQHDEIPIATNPSAFTVLVQHSYLSHLDVTMAAVQYIRTISAFSIGNIEARTLPDFKRILEENVRLTLEHMNTIKPHTAEFCKVLLQGNL